MMRATFAAAGGSMSGGPASALAASTIAGSRVEIFDERDGGSHFMFMENPTRFNQLVTEFLG
jgi:hypothetical protein